MFKFFTYILSSFNKCLLNTCFTCCPNSNISVASKNMNYAKEELEKHITDLENCNQSIERLNQLIPNPIMPLSEIMKTIKMIENECEYHEIHIRCLELEIKLYEKQLSILN